MHHHDPDASPEVLAHVTHLANTVAHGLDADAEIADECHQTLIPTLEHLRMPGDILGALTSKVKARLAELEEMYR